MKKDCVIIKVEYTYIKAFDNQEKIDAELNKIALGKFEDKNLKSYFKRITKFEAKKSKIEVK